MRCSRETFVTFRCRRRDERAQALPQSRPMVKGPLSACVREASVKIRVILVMSLVALGSGAASTKPLFSPMFGEVIPPRPPRPIGGSTSHQPDLPPTTPGNQPEQKPAAATAPGNQPEQKPAAATAPGNQPEQKPAAATAPGNRPEQKPTKKKPTASTTARMPAAAASPVKQPEQKSTKQPEQKPTAAAVLAKPGVVTIGHSAATPRPTGSTSQVPSFPAAQTL